MQTKTRAQLFADFANPPERIYRRDPVRWATERAKVELWSKQRDVLNSIRDHRKTAVHSCHETGKSWSAALTVAWWLDVHPLGSARAVTTAPTSKQVDAVLWYEINKHHARIGLRGRLNKNEWWLDEPKQLIGLGRKPPDHVEAAFQGLHARYMLVVLDEAFGIPKRLWDEASTLAANEHSRILVIGNPDGPGEFENVCKRDPDWNVIHIGYEHTPNFTGESVSQELRDMLIHPSWVEERRRKWGEQSALFQSKCAGQFPTVGSPWQIVPYDWASQCRWLEYPAANPVEAGIDVGAGNDRTVITVRAGKRVLNVKQFVDADPMRTVALLATHLRENKVTCVKVDVIGIGWGIYGRLRELSSRNNHTGSYTTHDADVVPINVGDKPTPGNEERFLNRRAEMWWDIGREHSRLKQWDFSQLAGELQDDLIHELTMPEYQILDSYGKVKVEPKEQIRQRLGASPDLAESLLLAFVPANWVAETKASALLAAPSLLGSYGAGDALGPRGW